MPDAVSFTNGSFCWCEAVTSDQSAGKSFYSNLFGWTSTDSPTGPDSVYTMFQLDGKNVGALYGMDAAQLERGVPPHWNVYVAVSSVDETTAKAKAGGATILAEPFDVMDVGRMAVIQDPGGANLSLWQAAKHKGAEIVDQPGAFCWYELATKNIDGSKQFYSDLFGWKAGGSEDYTEWIQDGTSVGGMMNIPDVPPNWMPYVMVGDIDSTALMAVNLGGTVLVQPADAGAHGRFCVIMDPQGATLGVYQRK